MYILQKLESELASAMTTILNDDKQGMCYKLSMTDKTLHSHRTWPSLLPGV